MPSKPRHLLSLSGLRPEEIDSLLKSAQTLKSLRGKPRHPRPLSGKTLAMIFEKSSTRTRVSFEVAMHELGGHALSLSSQEIQIGRGESYKDTARVLSRYVHGIVLRTYSQKNLEELAAFATVPVINGLSDLFHPVQILADLLTISEFKKDFRKVRVSYIGDGNNLANSWIEASTLLGFPLQVACPRGYSPPREVLDLARNCPQITIGSDPVQAVCRADVVYTDTWFSMGQKVEAKKRRLFAPFQINRSLLRKAASRAIVLHCLPAHPGEEISEEIMEEHREAIFTQAENRLHAQKALLQKLFETQKS